MQMQKMMKIFLSILCFFAFFIVKGQSENSKPWFDKYLRLRTFNYEKAAIKIDDKIASYADLMAEKDTSLLKVEVYPRKEALKRFSVEEARGGVVLLTTKRYVPVQFPIITTPDSCKYYIDGNDTVFSKSNIPPAIEGDTTHRTWQRFLVRNLNAGVAADNGAPIGLYVVTARFFINADGSITGLKIDEDPGYGTGAEALRILSKSSFWSPGT